MVDALGLSHHARIHWGLGLVICPAVAGGGSVDIAFDVVADRADGQAVENNCLKLPHFSAVSRAMKLSKKISRSLSVETT